MTWLARLKSKSASDTQPTKPTKPGYVGSVGTQDGHIQKIEGATPAANDPDPDPDEWCWPHSTAMNSEEIDRFMARRARFTDKGLDLEVAELLADRLVIRDRDKDDRRLCMECAHLQQSGRCGNWERAGVAARERDAQLATEIVQLLQRCDGFKGV